MVDEKDIRRAAKEAVAATNENTDIGGSAGAEALERAAEETR